MLPPAENNINLMKFLSGFLGKSNTLSEKSINTSHKGLFLYNLTKKKKDKRRRQTEEREEGRKMNVIWDSNVGKKTISGQKLISRLKKAKEQDCGEFLVKVVVLGG